MRIVVAGVSGSGKTTIGELLAERLNYEFVDADAFHPPANIEKMSAGIPLTDEDREGWLDAMGDYLQKRGEVVLACSALKKIYRDHLRASAGPIRFIVLTADPDTLRKRMAEREHFMPPALLDSQLATLELGDDVTAIPNEGEPVAAVEKALVCLGD